MEQITTETLETFFQKLGERAGQSASLFIGGGSALILLGSTRETIDVDYSIETSDTGFEQTIDQLADELQMDFENVPLQEFVPVSKEAGKRHRLVGKYGKVNVYIFDPYAIALSKLDRGFDTDIDDIVFLIRHGLVTLFELEKVVQDALPLAKKFDLNASEIQSRLQLVRDML